MLESDSGFGFLYSTDLEKEAMTLIEDSELLEWFEEA
jgi:hypothetical protein